MRGRRTILLTGASGVVGRAVAAELRDDHVIGLVHSDANVPEVDEVVRSDVSQPRLGLDAGEWRRLAARTDTIIHSAALTEWGAPREQHDAINVGGMREVIELAQAAGASIHNVSTCFVRAIELDATHLLNPDNVVRSYITTKLEAEHLLTESGVPHSTYRPTNLVGDSQTGASSRPQIVQMLSAWICRGKAPFFPAHPGNLIDVAPLDVCAIAIARAVEADDLGQMYWLTYGEQGMTVEDTLAVATEHARSLGREIAPVPIIDPREPLPVSLDSVPPRSRAFLKVLIDVSEIVHASGGVLPTSVPELGERHGVPMPSDREAYRLSLEYWSADRAGAREMAKEAT
jgi:nucleoside-diphosphate-sugar epimerase